MLHQGLCYTILIVWLGAYAYIMVAGAPGIISCSSRKDQLQECMYINVRVNRVSPLFKALSQSPTKQLPATFHQPVSLY